MLATLSSDYLNDAQRNEVRAMGFGSLLGIPKGNLNHDLILALANAYNPSKFHLLTPIGKVDVTWESVAAVFGMPAFGEPFKSSKEVTKEHESMLLEFKNKSPNALKQIICIVDGLIDGANNYKKGLVSSLNGCIYVLQGLVKSKVEQPVLKRPVRPKKRIVKEATKVEKEQSEKKKVVDSPKKGKKELREEEKTTAELRQEDYAKSKKEKKQEGGANTSSNDYMERSAKKKEKKQEGGANTNSNDYMERSAKVKSVKENVAALEMEMKKLKAMVAVVEVDLEMARNELVKVEEGFEKRDLDGELGY
ncbi:uncharacterized protein DS421_12g387980 [Arachis hypogaea]|nr:uncharacterized protein DS421_12g387980 [Arachis hypogaea]